MTDQETRIAIATACGWRRIFGSLVCWNIPESSPARTAIVSKEYNSLPDYLNSLDACHEAEQTLSWAEREAYYVELMRMTQEHLPRIDWVTVPFRVVSATAAQRAQAFVRTIAARAAKP